MSTDSGRRKFLSAAAGLSGGALVAGAAFPVHRVEAAEVEDHSNRFTPGSVAYRLIQARNDGGGTVVLEPGVYRLITPSSLVLGKNVRLVGAGRSTTILQVEHDKDAIRADGWPPGALMHWGVHDLEIRLPTGVSGNGIATRQRNANYGEIRNVMVTGGSPSSWGLYLDAANYIQISHFVYWGQGSGIRWCNDLPWPVNYGDSTLENSEITLDNSSATGIQFYSPPDTLKRINNVLVSGVSVRMNQGHSYPGTVGIHMHNAARITLLNVDLEGLETGILLESAVNGGAQSVSNGFFQVFALGCETDYQVIGVEPARHTVLGGQGDFAVDQWFPGDNVYVSHSRMGTNRLLSAVRPIEAHTNSGVTYQLDVEDSGKIFTNRGAAGTVRFQLPSATQFYSIEFEFHLAQAGYAIEVIPASGDLIRTGKVASHSPFRSGTTPGQSLKLRNIDDKTWTALSLSGDWNPV